MATADQVKALIRSHVGGDNARFDAIAMPAAAQVARCGHGEFAQEPRELVDLAKTRAGATEPSRGTKTVPLTQARGELAGLPPISRPKRLLTVGYPKTHVSEMALPDAPRTRLERLLAERRERGRPHAPEPPLSEQHAILVHTARRTAKLDDARAATERIIAPLKERCAALMTAAVAGKLDVMGSAA